MLRSDELKMALEAPIRNKKNKPKPKKPSVPGLPLNISRQVSYYFTTFESDCGLKSVAGSVGELPSIRSMSFLPPFVANLGGLSKKDDKEHKDTARSASSVYRTLRRMAENGLGREIAVLYCYYGPQRISAPHGAFGEWAQLAKFTHRVGKVREELVYKYRHKFDDSGLGMFDGEAVERILKGWAKEAESVTEEDAISFALSGLHSLSYRKDFTDKVIDQAKATLNKAATAYMENLTW